MSNEVDLTLLNRIAIEAHADLEHEIWSSWMQYMFSMGIFNPDGTWTMPKWAAERWQRQMRTPYLQLSAKEQASDLEQVQKHIALAKSGVIDRKEGTGLPGAMP